MFFKNLTKKEDNEAEYFYIPLKERPQNLKDQCESGHLWTYLQYNNVIRHFYTSPEHIPEDKNHVAMSLKVLLNKAQQSQLERLSASSSVYRGALSFQPDEIESCIILDKKGMTEYKRVIGVESQLDAGCCK